MSNHWILQLGRMRLLAWAILVLTSPRVNGEARSSAVGWRIDTVDSTPQALSATVSVGDATEGIEDTAGPGGHATGTTVVTAGRPIPVGTSFPNEDEGIWVISLDVPIWATRASVRLDTGTSIIEQDGHPLRLFGHETVGGSFMAGGVITFFSGDDCGPCKTSACSAGLGGGVGSRGGLASSPRPESPELVRGDEGEVGGIRLSLPLEDACCGSGSASDELYAVFHASNLAEGLGPSLIRTIVGLGNDPDVEIWKYPSEITAPAVQLAIGNRVYVIEEPDSGGLRWRVYDRLETAELPADGMLDEEELAGFELISSTSFTADSSVATGEEGILIDYEKDGALWGRWRVVQNQAQRSIAMEDLISATRTEIRVEAADLAAGPWKHKRSFSVAGSGNSWDLLSTAAVTVSGSGQDQRVVAEEQGGELVRTYGYDPVNGWIRWENGFGNGWKYYSYDEIGSRFLVYEPYGDAPFPEDWTPPAEGGSDPFAGNPDGALKVTEVSNGSSGAITEVKVAGVTVGRWDSSSKLWYDQDASRSTWEDYSSDDPEVPGVFRDRLLLKVENGLQEAYRHSRGNLELDEGSTEPVWQFTVDLAGSSRRTIREVGHVDDEEIFWIYDDTIDYGGVTIGGGFGDNHDDYGGGDGWFPAEREVSFYDPQDRLVRRDREVLGEGGFVVATSTSWKYGEPEIAADVWLQTTEEWRDGRLVRSVVLPVQPDVSSRTETGEDGTSIVTVRDALGRMLQEIRESPGGPIQTDYSHQGRTVEKRVNGNLVKVETRDLRGRLESSVNEQGIQTVYGYELIGESGARLESVSTPVGTIETEFYLDGRVKARGRDGVQLEAFLYEIEGSSGFERTTRVLGPAGSPRYQQALRDWGGRVREIVRPSAPTGEGNPPPIVEEYQYDPASGSLATVTSNVVGIPVRRVESDRLGYEVARGKTIESGGFEDDSENDRFSRLSTSFELGSDDHWWEVTRHRRFIGPPPGAADGADAEFAETTTKRRLWVGDGEVSIMVDEANVETVTTRTFDRGSGMTRLVTEDPRTGIWTVDHQFGFLVIRYPGITPPEADGAGNRPESVSYDGRGREVGRTNALGGLTRTVYNQQGQVEEVIDPLNRTTRYSYYPASHPSAGRLEKVVHPGGVQAIYTYDLEGHVATVRGTAAYPVDYAYTEWGELYQMTTYGTETAITTWDRDPATGLLLEKRYHGQPVGDGVGYTYWPDGRLKSRTWRRGTTTDYAYNGWGDLTHISYSDEHTPDIEFTDFDRLGRPWTVRESRAGEIDTTQLSYHSVTGEESTAYPTGHDFLGGLALTRLAHDLGRPGGFSLSDGSGLLQTVPIAYDNGRLWKVGPDGDQVEYGYHGPSSAVSSVELRASGDLVQMVAKNVDLSGALVGVVTRTPGDQGTEIAFASGYVLDPAGRRKRASREDGSAWDYDYNDRSEVIGGRKHLPDGSLAPGMQFGYEYDGIGNREKARSGGDSTGGDLRSIEYTPDALNQYTQVTHPGSFDVLARSGQEVGFSVAGSSAIIQEARDGFHRAKVSAGNGGAEPNEGGRWLGVEVESPLGSGNAQGGAFWLEPAIVQPVHDADGNLVEDGRWIYTWDGENRLIELKVRPEARSGADPHPWKRITYQYDWRGRRIGRTLWTGSEGSEQRESSTRWLYDGWNPVAGFTADAESGGSLTRSAEYHWGIDLSGTFQGAGGVGGLWKVVRHSGGSTTRYFPAFDGNGNVIGWTADNGAVLQRIDYDPFGRPLIRETTPGTEGLRLGFGFSTKLEEEESGLVYYGYRYYDSKTGRWLNRDPIGESRETGEFNLYALVTNNGLNWYDVHGLQKNRSGWVPLDLRGGGQVDPLIRKALERVLKSCTLRCYLLDLTDEEIEEMLQAIRREIPVTETQVFDDWLSGIPGNAASKYLAVNATVLDWAARKPQGVGVSSRTIASVLNNQDVLNSLRRQATRQSLKAVGKGGVKVWGRLGSKLVPFVGWFSLGYEAVKACNCAIACEDEKFTEDEEIIGQ